MLDNLHVTVAKEVIDLESVTLPYRYVPYPHQEPLLNTFFDMLEGSTTVVRYGLEWHRRAGKDMTFWQMIVAAAVIEVGDYAYMLPTNQQAMKVIWNGTVNDCDNEPCKFFDFIPPGVQYVLHKTEHRIEFSNGSSIYIFGSDNYDSNVGMNLKGVVFSEWSLCNPDSYSYFEPMLLKNNELNPNTGWALFCWTPRGKNHAWKTRETAQEAENKDFWYFSSLTVDDTVDCFDKPIFSKEAIERVLRGGANPDLVKQEYYLDYQAAVQGVIYADQMTQARAGGRITDTSSMFNPKLKVHTFWDIGVADATSIWFMQSPKDLTKEHNPMVLIGYYQANRSGMQHYVEYLKEFQERKGFRWYGSHYLPHDVKVTEWGSGETRKQQLSRHLSNVTTVPRCSKVSNGIYQTKSVFDRFIFDEKECAEGIECLDNYRYKESNGIYTGEVHDKFSHGADSLRQLGQTYGILPDEDSDRIMSNLMDEMNHAGKTSYAQYNPLKR